MINSEELRNKFAGKLEENILLRDFTSIGVGGVADYFLRAKTVDELVDAISYLSKKNIPYFILGGGYNLVFSDMGFPGVVIKNEVKDIVFSGDSSEVIVGSGVDISRLLMDSASRDLGGLEFLYGIPGTIGGAIYGNVGAFSHTIGEYVKSITLLLPASEDRPAKIVRHTSKWIEFANRSSKLKEYAKTHPNGNKPVILSVKLQLAKSKKEIILRKMQDNLKLKKSSQPIDKKSAGCFFKNPGIGREQSAGFMLDQSGAKRFKIGGASVSRQHANFILNTGKATAEDIRRLANKMKDAVRENYRTNLEEEIEYIGNW